MRWMPRVGIVSFAFTLCLLTGCGGSEVPVTVIVTMDGEPLEVANVTLSPTGDTKGPTGSGTTDSNGKAIITTGQGKPGLVPGSYKAVVSKTDLKGGAGGVIDPEVTGAVDESSIKQSVPAKFSKPEQSNLTYTVESKATTIEIKLKSDKKK